MPTPPSPTASPFSTATSPWRVCPACHPLYTGCYPRTHRSPWLPAMPSHPSSDNADKVLKATLAARDGGRQGRGWGCGRVFDDGARPGGRKARRRSRGQAVDVRRLSSVRAHCPCNAPWLASEEGGFWGFRSFVTPLLVMSEKMWFGSTTTMGQKYPWKKYLDENCFTNVRNGGNGIVANTHGLRVALYRIPF